MLITRIVLVYAGGVALIIVGIIVLIFGLLILVWSVNLPTLFAGQYLVFFELIVVAGIVLVVLGARTGRSKGPKPIPSVNCKNCGSSNPVTSEFCGKCGIKNV